MSNHESSVIPAGVPGVVDLYGGPATPLQRQHLEIVREHFAQDAMPDQEMGGTAIGWNAHYQFDHELFRDTDTLTKTSDLGVQAVRFRLETAIDELEPILFRQWEPSNRLLENLIVPGPFDSLKLGEVRFLPGRPKFNRILEQRTSEIIQQQVNDITEGFAVAVMRIQQRRGRMLGILGRLRHR